MHYHYLDIIERIPGPPLWWDEHAVPRYCEFSPDVVANIYADDVCLLHIDCQSCGAAFKVAFSRSKYEAFRMARDFLRAKGNLDPSLDEIGETTEQCTLEAAIRAETIHYGDPPNAGCCPAGPTMNSVPRQVLEYWTRMKGEVKEGFVKDPLDYMQWKRKPELEITIEPEWWSPETKTS